MDSASITLTRRRQSAAFGAAHSCSGATFCWTLVAATLDGGGNSSDDDNDSGGGGDNCSSNDGRKEPRPGGGKTCLVGSVDRAAHHAAP